MVQPGRCQIRIHRSRRSVFLKVHPFFIEINTEIIFRQIAIIDPVAMHTFLVSPFLHFFHILAQTVDKLVVISDLSQIPDERLIMSFRHGSHQQSTGQITVVKLVPFLPCKPERIGQFRTGQKDRQPPPGKSLSGDSAIGPVEERHFLFLQKPLAERKIRKEHSAPSGRLQPGDLSLPDLDMICKAGPRDIHFRGGHHRRIGIIPQKPWPMLRQARFFTGYRLVNERFPQGGVMLPPPHEAKPVSR